MHVSEYRIPYTYHHDYIRMNAPYKLSRSDVATFNSNEDQLYACVLLYFIQFQSIEMICAGVDASLLERCIKIKEQELDHIESLLNTYTTDTESLECPIALQEGS